MSRSTLRPVIKLRSTAGTGYTYVTRKSRRNDPDRLVIRKYDPVAGRHVEFREDWPGRFNGYVAEIAVRFNNWHGLSDAFLAELGTLLGARWRVVHEHL